MTFTWAVWGAFTVITFILISFIVPRNGFRLLVLGTLWAVLFLILEIVASLIIVNMGQFSKPDDNAP